MAKSKINAPSVNQITEELKNNKISPVYFLFGQDTFSIDSAISHIENTVIPLISSDFDKETFYGDNNALTEILNFAAAFPFGTGKKFIIVKEFERIRDKKNLTPYLQSPPEFTVIVFINNGEITNPESEPFKSLVAKNFIYEAKELKGENLINWLVSYTKSKGKLLNSDNARLLVDISGENRETLEAQLEKIFVFLGNKNEVTFDVVKSLSTSLKKYSIFDLQNAVGKKNKTEAFKIAFNLLETEKITFLINMLTRYFTGLSKVNELNEKKITGQPAARIVGTHPYYYKDYLAARSIYSDRDIFKAANALLNADLAVKTTSSDEKTIISILLAEIFS